MVDRIIGIILLLLLISCSNEVLVNMDNEGVPVVYCILDMDDSVQEVRLAKSFLPDEQNPIQKGMSMARWDEPVEIYLEEWIDQTKPVIYEFNPINSVHQDTGFFATPSFQLYQASLKPVEHAVYYLYLWFPERNYYAYASTQAIAHTEIISPAAIPGRKVTFSDIDNFTVEIKPNGNSEYHQFDFQLEIEEHAGNETVMSDFYFGGQQNQEYDGQTMSITLNSRRFYMELLNRYDTLSGSAYRSINGLEFLVYSYGPEMRLYNLLYDNGLQPWEIQSYSSFKNGFGLFSSKATSRVPNLELSSLTYDILTGDSRYKHLKFVR